MKNFISVLDHTLQEVTNRDSPKSEEEIEGEGEEKDTQAEEPAEEPNENDESDVMNNGFEDIPEETAEEKESKTPMVPVREGSVSHHDHPPPQRRRPENNMAGPGESKTVPCIYSLICH